MKCGIALTLCLLLALTLSCSDDANTSAPTRPYQVGLYAGEVASLEEVEASLPLTAQHGYQLMVAAPVGDYPSAKLERLLHQASDLGVEVRLWPLISKADGYWPNEDNLNTFGQYVRKLLGWLQSRGLKASAMIFDMEPAFAYSEAIQKSYSTGITDAIKLMRGHLNPAAYAAAKQKLRALVQEVQAAGLRAQCVTFPQVIDDQQDSDEDLQDALDIPVQGVPWDEVSFMVYQSTYARMLGSWIGPALIRSYAADIHRAYGKKGTMALGVVGKAGVMTQGATLYPDPATLAKDVAAALAEGVPRVEVFSLDGMRFSGQLEKWLEALGNVQPARPVLNTQADMVRKAIIALDAMLDSGPAADASLDTGPAPDADAGGG